MIALVGSVLATSLLGSPHCAGMCGGFVCFYAGDLSGARRLWAHAAYNAGRLTSYLALGLIAGALGAGVDHLGALAGLGRAAAVVAGALMIAWGAVGLLRALGVGVPARAAPSWLHGALAAIVRALRDGPPAARAATLGLVTTLLPCGFLYAFVAVAAGTGSAPAGALVMALFWAGTVPVMAGLGLLAQRGLGPLRRRVPALTASALVVLGLLTVVGKMSPRSAAHDHMRHDLHAGRETPHVSR